MFLTCHLPYPPHSGGRRREYELLRRVCAEREVELYAVCKTPEDFDNAAALAEHCADIRLFAADPVAAVDELAGADRFQMHHSRELTDAVRARLRRGSMVVHVEGSYLMQHLPAGGRLPTVLAEQNVESSLWLQRAACARDAERRVRLSRFERTIAAEAAAWARAELCAAVSDADAAEIARRSGREVVVVPDGCDHLDAGRPPAVTREGTVAMISNLAYEPNLEAARLLADHVFPSVRRRLGDARLLLVGNGPPDDLLRRSGSQGLLVTGRVESVAPYRDQAAVIVAPHRVGGGVKVQVLEAIRRGKALVASSVALQGLPRAAREQLAPVDGAEATAAALVAALRDADEQARLEERSLRAAARLPTWDQAAELLLDAYRRAAAYRLARRWTTGSSSST
jgi:glycosyltransferase involved in cell wall biosynthesis